jgi:hypothetical protein
MQTNMQITHSLVALVVSLGVFASAAPQYCGSDVAVPTVEATQAVAGVDTLNTIDTVNAVNVAPVCEAQTEVIADAAPVTDIRTIYSSLLSVAPGCGCTNDFNDPANVQLIRDSAVKYGITSALVKRHGGCGSDRLNDNHNIDRNIVGNRRGHRDDDRFNDHFDDRCGNHDDHDDHDEEFFSNNDNQNINQNLDSNQNISFEEVHETFDNFEGSRNRDFGGCGGCGGCGRCKSKRGHGGRSDSFDNNDNQNINQNLNANQNLIETLPVNEFFGCGGGNNGGDGGRGGSTPFFENNENFNVNNDIQFANSDGFFKRSVSKRQSGEEFFSDNHNQNINQNIDNNQNINVEKFIERFDHRERFRGCGGGFKAKRGFAEGSVGGVSGHGSTECFGSDYDNHNNNNNENVNVNKNININKNYNTPEVTPVPVYETEYRPVCETVPTYDTIRTCETVPYLDLEVEYPTCDSNCGGCSTCNDNNAQSYSASAPVVNNFIEVDTAAPDYDVQQPVEVVDPIETVSTPCGCHNHGRNEYNKRQLNPAAYSGVCNDAAYNGAAYTNGVYNDAAYDSAAYTNGVYNNAAYDGTAYTNGVYNGAAYDGAYNNGLYNNAAYDGAAYNNDVYNNNACGYAASAPSPVVDVAPAVQPVDYVNEVQPVSVTEEVQPVEYVDSAPVNYVSTAPFEYVDEVAPVDLVQEVQPVVQTVQNVQPVNLVSETQTVENIESAPRPAPAPCAPCNRNYKSKRQVAYNNGCDATVERVSQPVEFVQDVAPVVETVETIQPASTYEKTTIKTIQDVAPVVDTVDYVVPQQYGTEVVNSYAAAPVAAPIAAPCGF